MVAPMTVRSLPIVTAQARRPRALARRARVPVSAGAVVPLIVLAALVIVTLYLTASQLLPVVFPDSASVLNYDPDATFRALF